MNIILDGFGGDKAPFVVLKGAELAVKEWDINITVVGDEVKLKKAMEENNINDKNIKFVHTSGAPITMEDQPTEVIKSKKDSSLAIACNLLRDGEGDALVSAANTGAILVGGTMIVKRIKGVKRPAIGTTIPTRTGTYLLIDSGANSDVRPEMLVQFGIMGSAYLKSVLGLENPRVGLVNNGSEEEKGSDIVKATYPLMKEAPFNFVGNIEGNLLNAGACDVAVCDGFTGNVILKVTEGLSKALMGMIKDTIMSSTKGKIGGILIKSSLNKLKDKLDPNETGGAPLLGLEKPVIKAHGGSNEIAIKNAIYQAKLCVDNNMTQKLRDGLEKIKEA